MGKYKEKENQRKLSDAEEKRRLVYEQLRDHLKQQGYRERDLTVGLVFANVMALVLGIFPCILFVCSYIQVNGGMNLRFRPMQGLLFLGVFLLMIVAHELIHGIFWALFAEGHWNSIAFGFIREYLTPYCTCTVPLKKGQYVIGM